MANEFNNHFVNAIQKINDDIPIALYWNNYLTDIIKSTFDECLFPEMLRESIVVPIQKISWTTDVNEFRPINTLLCIEKLIERVACDQLNKFIEENKVICREQSGFRYSHSCEIAINYVIDDWKGVLDNKESVPAWNWTRCNRLVPNIPGRANATSEN